MSEPQKPSGKADAGIAAAIVAACLICAPLTARFEGKRNAPYRDPAGIKTVCYGETETIMRVYSNDECGRMLRDALAKRYAPKIAQCLPQLAAPNRRNEFVAMIDSSYNAGWAAVCKSSMAQHIRAGQWVAACNSLKTWYTTARDRRTGKRVQWPGLVNRRAFFAGFCLKPE